VREGLARLGRAHAGQGKTPVGEESHPHSYKPKGAGPTHTLAANKGSCVNDISTVAHEARDSLLTRRLDDAVSLTVDGERKAKFAPMKPYNRVGEQLSVVRISKNGQTVTLSDGSRWRVSVGDVTRTLCWYATQRVVVGNCDDVFIHTNYAI